MRLAALTVLRTVTCLEIAAKYFASWKGKGAAAPFFNIMKSFLASLGCVLILWAVWYWALAGLMPAGVEAAEVSFLRVWQNFSNAALTADLLLFLLSQSILLVFLALLVFLIKESMSSLLGVSSWVGLAVGGVSVFVFFSALNSLFYPLSASAFTVKRPWVDVVVLFITVFFVLLASLASLRDKKVAAVFFPMTLAVLFFLGLPYMGQDDGVEEKYLNEKPNIIILGVDAMRPSELLYFGGKHEVTPFIDSLLERAQVYYPAYTPVARTHPAWVSILTGKYPVNNGARFNLTNDEKINKEDLISVALKSNGYRTVWALDERRFNSIDDYYGFDETIGPQMGAADFVLTKVSDIPPINVFLNTNIGRILFPFLYNNRGNYVTYVPYLFNDDIVGALRSDKPIFLAAHFCLPHYPFVNNLMPSIDFEGQAPATYSKYLSMLKLADSQLEDLFNKMVASGVLDNAVVYLVSDHGEGFPGVDPEVKSGNPYASFKADQFGHGTNVLSLPQYEVLLSKVKFINGKPVGEPKRINRLSSLVDLAPDIAKTLGISKVADGLPFDQRDGQRNVYIESSFSPTAVSSSRINEVALLQQAMDAYIVNAEGELRLAPRLYDALSEGKQRALISPEGVVVALYPDEKESAFIMDAGTSIWWPSLTEIPRDMGDWKALLFELCEFNKVDPDFKESGLCAQSKASVAGNLEKID